MSTYIQDALRTKSPQFNLPDEFVEVLVDATRAAAGLGGIIGALKKSIFYGKPFTDPTNGDDPWLPDVIEPNTAGLDADIVHGIIGLVTESCELMELIYESLKTGQPIDLTKLIDESGDQMWYLAILLSKLGVDFEAVQRGNIAKLKARYPEKFDAVAFDNRNKAEETAALTAAV
jgi:NTP pyrophosphatase (non-canonical NTP hydrolase)